MNIRAFASAILAFTVAAGCTDFEPIPEDVCGNLVLEAGEDCDGVTLDENGEPFGTCGAADDTDNACFFVCDAAADPAIECPLGWGCGSDGRCRRPSGEFALASESLRFDVNQFDVGDLDGDGNADLIGLDNRAISIRYGAGDGSFPAELEFLTRAPTGPATFGHFNSDGLTDIVVPTDTGLFVALGESERGLDPVAYAPFAFANANLRIHPVNNGTAPFPELPGVAFPALLLVVGDPAGGGDFMQFIDGDPLLLPTGTVGAIPGRIPVAEIDLPAPVLPHEDWVISTSGARAADVYTTTLLAPNTPIVRDTVNLPGGLHVGMMWAQVDGTGGLDLLVSFLEDGTGLSRVGTALHTNTLAGLQANATKINAFDRQNPSEIPFPLAAADFDGDGRDDYVVREGVLIARGPADQPPNLMVPTTIAINGIWSDATTGDYNNDGNTDFAAALAGQDGIDVYLGDGTGLFNRFSVSTGVPAGSLRSSDFDGDFVDDIGFIAEAETDDDHDELLVAFGQLAGGPTEPIAMGRLNRVDELEPVPALGLFDADLATDLIVVSSSLVTGDTAIAVMQGSSSRRMISPFSLQANNEDYIPRQAVFGNILEDDELTDIVAVAEPVNQGVANPSGVDGNDTAVADTFVFRIPGKDEQGGLDAAKVEFDELDANEFAMRCARWAVGDLDATGVDDLVGIDRAQECAGSQTSPPPQAVVLPNNNISQMVNTQLDGIGFTAPDVTKIKDLDGDGAPDYMVLFRGDFRDATNAPGEAIDGSGVSVFWNSGGELQLDSNFSAVHVEDGSRLQSVAPARLNDDIHTDLLVLTSSGLWPAIYQPEDQSFAIGDPITVPRDATLLATGDFNGDGLDDVAYVYGTSLDIHLGIPAAPRGGAQ